MFGDYAPQSRGVTGGSTDIRAGPQLTGALSVGAAENGGNWLLGRGRGGGLAASLPADNLGVIVNDEDPGHHHTPRWGRTGHHGASNANMLDSRFAQNTAATSDRSLLANWNAMRAAGISPLSEHPSETYWENPLKAAQEHLEHDGLPTQKMSAAAARKRNFGDRATRLGDDVLIKGPADPTFSTRSLLTRDYTGTELGALGLATYAAYSVLAR